MRRKLHPEVKRTEHIGILVQKTTKKQLKFIAEREGNQLSTQIDEILKEYISKYFRKNNITWQKLTTEERGEEDD